MRLPFSKEPAPATSPCSNNPCARLILSPILLNDRPRFLIGFGVLLCLYTLGFLPTLCGVSGAADRLVAARTDATPSKREAQEEEITSTNWQQHPRIKAVRATVQSIDTGIKNGSFNSSERRFKDCSEIFRKKAVDARGVARRYERKSEDESGIDTEEYYYDEAGRVRFVFIFGWVYTEAVPRSELEHRIYFDETGKRIWEQNKYLKGPGDPTRSVFEVWSDEDLVLRDPAKAFSASSPCEMKSRSKARQ